MQAKLYFDKKAVSFPQVYVPATYVHLRPRGENEKKDPPAFRLGSVRENGEVIEWGSHEVIGSWSVVGNCTRTNPLWVGEYNDADAVEVTMNDGRIVPCIRPTGGHQILQNFDYKILHPGKAQGAVPGKPARSANPAMSK